MKKKNEKKIVKKLFVLFLKEEKKIVRKFMFFREEKKLFIQWAPLYVINRLVWSVFQRLFGNTVKAAYCDHG
jgi:hypothetical protein